MTKALGFTRLILTVFLLLNYMAATSAKIFHQRDKL